MKTVKRLLGLMLAVVLAAGTLQGTACASQKESARTDAAAVFGNKVKELEKKYGVLKEGRETIRIDTKEYFTSMESPFEADKDGGMLFAYVHDFDLDGADELLTLRRERGTASLIQDGTPFDSDMYKYIFDMFEMKDGQCTHADSRTIGVFDVLNWSINYKCISVFLHETDRFVDICTETFISQQDHPSDTALVRIRYNGTVFSDDNGIRFGYWYSENGVRCMKPVSEAALRGAWIQALRDKAGFPGCLRPIGNERCGAVHDGCGIQCDYSAGLLCTGFRFDDDDGLCERTGPAGDG